MTEWQQKQAAARAERNAKVVAMIKAGASQYQVAARLGISRTTVKVILDEHAQDFVEVPAWVPAYLDADYRAVAVEKDEHAAASYARNQLKQQVLTGSLDCRGR